jgi:hypothetical protein
MCHNQALKRRWFGFKSSGMLTLCCVSKDRVSDPEDGGTTILGIVANCSLNDTRYDLSRQQHGHEILKYYKRG